MQPFIGTWRLIDQLTLDADGGQTHSRGENPQGILMYDGAGNMNVQMMRRERIGNDMANLQTALSDYVGYFGTYIVDEAAGTITHHVEGSSYPGWIGTTQRREYHFEGDRLTLSADADDDGKLTRRVAIWVREA